MGCNITQGTKLIISLLQVFIDPLQGFSTLSHCGFQLLAIALFTLQIAVNEYNHKNQRPEVLISSTRQGEGIELRVTDNGIGIPVLFQEKIFEAFKRLHSRAEYGGSGLGLAIVKLAVGKLGGDIRLESEEGKGSTFIMTFREQANEETDQ